MTDRIIDTGTNARAAQLLNCQSLSGERGLAAAVIARAVMDATRGTPELREDAERFFRSTWYGDLCEFLGVEAERPAILEISPY